MAWMWGSIGGALEGNELKKNPVNMFQAIYLGESDLGLVKPKGGSFEGFQGWW
jgi:hypothetical protein